MAIANNTSYLPIQPIPESPIPYFRRTVSKGLPPSSSSLTKAILNASLYLIPRFLSPLFCSIGDNLFQEVKSWLNFVTLSLGFTYSME